MTGFDPEQAVQLPTLRTGLKKVLPAPPEEIYSPVRSQPEAEDYLNAEFSKIDR